MKRLKNEKGVITMITLITVLFVVSFLITSYIVVANKVKTQKEILSETSRIYEPKSTMEEIYNSYFNNENIIPIYTVEQLLMMGNGNENVNINGKYYNFNNDENTIYVLMNDLKFKASDYLEQLTNGYWTPIGENSELIAKFEGKNNSIEVIYVDDENDEYSIIYSENNNYSEPEYIINIIPTFLDGTIASEAYILLSGNETGLKGQSTIKIKRRNNVLISVYLNDSYNRPEKSVSIMNPNKFVNTITLVLEEST